MSPLYWGEREMSKVPKHIIEEMLEEVQVEARFCNVEDAMLCLAKRDALSEVLARMRGRSRNTGWARMRPRMGFDRLPLSFLAVLTACF